MSATGRNLSSLARAIAIRLAAVSLIWLTGSAAIAQTADAPATTAPSAGGAQSQEPRIRFNFRFQPWGEVLDWFAQQAGLSLVMEAAPPGTFNYNNDPKEYSPAQAIDLLNGILLTKGYTLVRREKMLMVVNLEDGVPPNLIDTVTRDELARRGEFEIVSMIITLKKISADEAELELTGLLGPQGSVKKMPKAQQVLVTESAGRLRQMLEIIDAIENPPSGSSIRIFKLQHATTELAADMIRQLLDIPADQFASTDGSVRIAIDNVGSSILVTGNAEAAERVSDIIKQIDMPIGGGFSGLGQINETPQLEVYPIITAEPATVLSVLQTLMAGQPDIRLHLDPVSNRIVALARPSQHATIAATMRQLEGEAQRIEVVQLYRLDPTTVISAITKMFSTDGTTLPPSGPKIDADAALRRLYIRGNELQIAQIKDLLAKIGESGAPADSGARGNMRMLPLTSRQARLALEQIEQLWPSMYGNKINVVTPSTGINARRPGVQPGAETPQSPPEETAPPDSAAAPNVRIVPQGAAPSDGMPRFAPGVGRPQLPRTEPPQAAPNEASSPARAKFMFVEETTITGEAGSPIADVPTIDELAALEGETAPRTVASEEPAGPKSVRGAPIVVVPTPNGLMLRSDDLEALDAFEELFNSLAAQSSANGREFTVFYLKSASATVVAATLEQILSGASSSASTSSSGSLLGNLAGAALGSAGGLVGSLLSLGSSGGFTTTGPIQIVPETRLNALIVQANAVDLDMVEQLLQILDQPETPETDVANKPRVIQVVNTSATSVADVVKQVYASRMESSGGGGGGGNSGRGPSPEDFLRLLGGGGRGGAGGRAAEEEESKMSIGVDTRMNTLIVSAPQPLFTEVESLVRMLDQPSGEASGQAFQVVTVNSANPSSVQQALLAILGGQATSRSSGSGGGGGSSGSNNGDGQRSPEDIRRAMEAMQRMQGGGGGPGGGPFSGGGPGGFFGGRGPGSFGGGGGPGGGPGGGFFGGRGPGGFSGGDRGGGDRGGGDRGGRD